ncbi:hypothetical protein RFI_03973, partial [Reticulomyxa filosa]
MALFEDTFEVIDVDKEGKRFDRVSRLECRAEEQEDVTLRLDYNCEIYRLEINNKFNFSLRTSLSDDTTVDVVSQSAEYDQSGDPSKADSYEYVMYGKIFRVEPKKKVVEIYASFGGLLMCLKGPPNSFKQLTMDKRIYLLIKK